MALVFREIASVARQRDVLMQFPGDGARAAKHNGWQISNRKAPTFAVSIEAKTLHR